MKKLLIAILLISSIVGVVAFSACTDGYKSDDITLSYDVTTDYGVYWYADGEYVRSSENMALKYFDPSKPTFVYAHGWEPSKSNSSNGLVEDLVTHADTLSNCDVQKVDYASLLKEQGYNVACLGWFDYASSLTALFKYIWVEFDGGYALSVRFAQELALVLGEDYQQQVKLMGHSYGAQVAVATTYQLTKFKEDGVISNSNIIPTRLTLADPYLGSPALISGWKNIAEGSIAYTNEPFNNREPKTLMADCIEYIVDKNDAAVDIYGGMIIAYDYYDYDGTDADFEKLSENCACVKCNGLLKIHSTAVHNITRDWLLISLVENIKLTDQNGDIAPTAAASDDEIKALRGKCYYQVKSKLDVANDSLELVDRSKIQY